MNRRFRASELSLHDVAGNLAPWLPHVETSPGVSSQTVIPPAVPPGVSSSSDRDSHSTRPGSRKEERDSVASGGTDLQRAQAVDALHSYIVAATGYDHGRALTILNRVITTLDNQLAASPRAEQDQRR